MIFRCLTACISLLSEGLLNVLLVTSLFGGRFNCKTMLHLLRDNWSHITVESTLRKLHKRGLLEYCEETQQYSQHEVIRGICKGISKALGATTTTKKNKNNTPPKEITRKLMITCGNCFYALFNGH